MDKVKVVKVKVPGSKSIAARALIANEVFGTNARFVGMPDCDDTLELRAALDQLHLNLQRGVKEREREDADCYNLGAGGTSLRFFLAYVASTPGFCGKIDCSDALRRRPLSPLIDALRSAGAKIDCLNKEGECPLYVEGKSLDGRGVKVRSGISSQFTSALLLVSPLWKYPFVQNEGGGVSRPYIEMTKGVIADFRKLAAESCPIYIIEGDWSAASYFYEYMLLHPEVKIEIDGLLPAQKSLQGDSVVDAVFRNILDHDESCGELKINACDFPDLVPALVVGMSVADISFCIEGIRHLRFKESNRISVLVEELAKCGIELYAGDDFIRYKKCGISSHDDSAPKIVVNSHGDHRIAMAFGAAASKIGNIYIVGAECVSKSFPDFFDYIRKLED